MSSFTKTYFVVGDNMFTMFFHGRKGAAQTSVVVDCAQPKRYFQIEFAKWTNALSKMDFAKEIHISLTEKLLRVTIGGSNNIINLGIIGYDKGAPEIELIDEFLPEQQASIGDAGPCMEVTDELVHNIAVATSMFSTVGKNNAIAIQNSGVLYADRSLVLKAKQDLSGLLPSDDDLMLLHKYTVGAILLAQKASPYFQFSSDLSSCFWSYTSAEGSTTQFVLVSEPCDISIPTEDELEQIRPSAGCGELRMIAAALLGDLEFFGGFYEASVWKPITFQIVASKEATLYYRHPTTEITRVLTDATGDLDGEFIIGSEALLKLVKAGEGDSEVVITYDQDSQGVRCLIGNTFDVVFAKLTE
jgi:hypothetical protein